MLTCRAAGAPTPDIKWFKDGTAIHSKSRFEIVQSGTLKIDGELRLQFSFIYVRTKRGRQPEAAVTVLAHHGTRNPNYFEISSPSWEASSIVEGRLHDLSLCSPFRHPCCAFLGIRCGSRTQRWPVIANLIMVE